MQNIIPHCKKLPTPAKFAETLLFRLGNLPAVVLKQKQI
jgi:hypothetical protein